MDRGIVFPYSQFGAVANGLIWGNGLCRSSDTVIPHIFLFPGMTVCHPGAGLR